MEYNFSRATMLLQEYMPCNDGIHQLENTIGRTLVGTGCSFRNVYNDVSAKYRITWIHL